MCRQASASTAALAALIRAPDLLSLVVAAVHAWPCPIAHLQEGLATHRPMPDFTAAAADLVNTTCFTYPIRFRQLISYSLCLRDYGARHQFMGG